MFDVNEQVIQINSKCDFKNIARGTDKYLAIKLNCDNEWKRMSKVVTIKDTNGIEYYIPYHNSSVYLTKDMTQGSMFGIKVTGKANGATNQTNIVWINQT